jgi:hypothetical protein
MQVKLITGNGISVATGHVLAETAYSEQTQPWIYSKTNSSLFRIVIYNPIFLIFLTNKFSYYLIINGDDLKKIISFVNGKQIYHIGNAEE